MHLLRTYLAECTVSQNPDRAVLTFCNPQLLDSYNVRIPATRHNRQLTNRSPQELHTGAIKSRCNQSQLQLDPAAFDGAKAITFSGVNVRTLTQLSHAFRRAEAAKNLCSPASMQPSKTGRDLSPSCLAFNENNRPTLEENSGPENACHCCHITG